MSYAIGRVIYGIVGNEKLNRQLKDFWGEEDFSELMEKWGFEWLYEGTAPWFFGALLDEIDETENVDLVEFVMKNISISPMESGQERFKPNISAQTEWNKKLQVLPEMIRKLIPEPKLLIVWESS